MCFYNEVDGVLTYDRERAKEFVHESERRLREGKGVTFHELATLPASELMSLLKGRNSTP